MPNWYYEKSNLKKTPSYLTGLDFDTETRYRREGARCSDMNLHRNNFLLWLQVYPGGRQGLGIAT